MSESAVRYQIDAQQYQQLLHELRQYRDAEQFPHTIPELRLRKGVITARNPATYTCSVLFGAADESAFPGVAVPGIRLADTVYPIVGAVCFVAFNGPDPTVLFTVGVGVGRFEAWKSITGNLANNTVDPIGFDTYSQTDTFHVTNTLWRIPWPGWYHLDAQTSFGADGVGRRLLDIRLNGSTNIGRFEPAAVSLSTTLGPHLHTARDIALDEGDELEVTAFQNSGGGLNISSIARYTPIFTGFWLGPP